MKSLLPVLAVLVAAAFAFCMPTASAEYDVIVVGDFEYDIVDGNGYLTAYSPKADPGADLVIPSSFNYQGTDYPVVGLRSYSIYLPGVVTVAIPDSVTTIEMFAIVSPTVTDINVDIGNSDFNSADGVLYDFNLSVIVTYPAGRTDASYTAEPSTVVVGAYAFNNNEHITSVTLPDSVYCINESAFESCTSLAHVNCTSAADTLPEKLIILGDYAFYECTALESLKFNDGLLTIGYYVFGYTGLHTVHIPAKVTSIAPGSFSSCGNLTAFESDNQDFPAIDGVLYELHNKEYSLLCYPAARAGDAFTVPSNVVYLSEFSFTDCANLKEVVLPDGMTVISYFSFENCRTLEKVTIPDSVVTIEMFAFSECVNLKEIELPGRLNSLGQYSFEKTGLVSLTIPASVAYIGYFAFSECLDLKSVVFEDGEIDLDYGIFFSCTALESIEFVGSSVTFEERALEVGTIEHHCTVTVTVPKGMSVPAEAGGDYTTLNVVVKGERPYPYENFIGVAICIIVLFGIIYAVREV